MRDRTVTASAAVLLAGNLFPPAATFVMAPLLAQALGVPGRGELAAITAPSLLALSIATLGVPDALTRAIAAGSHPSTRSWWTAWALVLGGGVAAFVASVLLAPSITGSARPGTVHLVALAAAAVLPGLAIGLLRARAAGEHAWGSVTAERIIAGSLKIAATVVLAASGHLTLTTATIVIAFSPLAGGLVYLRAARADTAGVLRPRQLLAFSARSWVGSIAGVLIVRLDQLLVLPLSDATQLGLYAVAVNLSEVPLVVTNAVREVMLAKDAGDNDDERVPRVARSAAVVAVAVAVPIGATAWSWVPVLFGPSFDPVLPVLAVALVGTVIGVPGSIAGSSLTARGRPELRSLSILVGCTANVAALLVLVPTLGAVGAAIATLIGNLLSSNGSVRGAARLTGCRIRDFYAVRPTDVRRVAELTSTLLRRPAVRT